MDVFLAHVDRGDTEAVKQQLLLDDDLKTCSTAERNALHRAAGYGHLDMVVELIRAGFNPLSASNTGRIPMHDACQGGHVGVVRELLKYGGTEALDSRGQSPLHLAAYHGEWECVRLLCAQSEHLTVRDGHQRTPVHLAAMMNQNRAMECLIEFGADVNLPDLYGRSSCHYASGAVDGSTLKTLIDRGVDLQARCQQGRLPLHYTVVGDRLSNLRLLLANLTKSSGSASQAKINLLMISDNAGRNSAHLAALNGSVECLHWILEQGMNPNTTDGSLNTPLHLAAGKSQILAYSCLLYHGADQTATNDKGETPMDIARRVGKPVAVSKAVSGLKACPRCRQKGLDAEWERRNSPAEIFVAIESSKEALFSRAGEGGAAAATTTRKGKQREGLTESSTSLAAATSDTSLASLLAASKRNIAAKYYGEFVN